MKYRVTFARKASATKAAVTDINKVIAKNIEKAAKDAIAATAANIKVAVSA